MPIFNFVPLVSVLVLLAPLTGETCICKTERFLSVASANQLFLIHQEPQVEESDVDSVSKNKRKLPATNTSPNKPETSKEAENNADANLADWPAKEAAQVTGLPSLLTKKRSRPEQDSTADDKTVKQPQMKLASQPKSTLPGNKKRTSVPFSEVIVKLEPIDTKMLSPEMYERRKKIADCLKHHYIKPVNADALRPWSIMHGVLAYGQDSLVVSRGKRINAVDYLCQNGIGNDRKLLMLNSNGISVGTGAGYQGHEGQLLAVLAQVQTPVDQPLFIDGKSFTVRDLVEYEKATCRPGTELTFKLIGLSVYLNSDAMWKDNTGQAWDISRLMYEEMAQPINGAACGGIHRLMGLSYALTMRKANNEPIDGQWKRAENFIANYHRQTLTLQTSDGGFSTEFFEGMSTSADPIRQIYSTGHVLEWLAISMSDKQLASQPITRMVDRLLALMASEFKPGEDLHGTDVGPKGHALRALRLYELRMFGQQSGYIEFRDQDPRPVVSADQIASWQQNQRTVLPSATGEAGYLRVSNPGTGAGNSSMPSVRGNRMMRRR